MSKLNHGSPRNSWVELLKWLLRKKRARKLVVVVLCASMLMLLSGWALGSVILISAGDEAAWQSFDHVMAAAFFLVTIAALFASGVLRNFILKMSNGRVSIKAWAHSRKARARNKAAVRAFKQNLQDIERLLHDAHPTTGELPTGRLENPDAGLGPERNEPTP